MLLLAAALASCATEEVAGTEGAVIGGSIASGPEFDAVLCMPQFGDIGAGCVNSGWHGCIARCEGTLTLVAPNIAMGSRVRFLVNTLPFELGQTTFTAVPSSAPPPDTLTSAPPTAFELGAAVNAVDDGPDPLAHAVGCLEQRRSGLAPCCKHPYFLDPALPHPLDGFHRRVYIPPVSLWDVPFTDPAHGVTVITESTFADYRAYLASCAQPMARWDELVSDSVFFILRDRIDEAVVAPIALALEYPDATSDPVWFETSAARGDVAGFGAGGPGETSLETTEGIRRVALTATALTRMPAMSDPTTRNPFAWAFPARADPFEVRSSLNGDGVGTGGGAAHMDCGAPWIFGAGADRRVFAANRVCSSIEEPFIDRTYSTYLTPLTAPYLRSFFDADGDGLLRGFRVPAAPDRIDRDGDGLFEYREIDGMAGVGGCLARVPAMPGRCWMPTRNDNCAPSPGGSIAGFANPTQLDRDGDLAGDACDVCPEVWDPLQETCAVRIAFAAENTPRGEALAAGDPIGRVCALRFRPNRDADSDGVSDYYCDNCVPPAGTPPGSLMRFVNPDQRDRDGDGVGDACDVCPDAPDSPGDSDADGIPNSCDNCRDHPNPDQANCNHDAEKGAGIAPRGDACDNRPCPQFQVINSSGWLTDSTFESVSSMPTGFGFAHVASSGIAATQGTIRTGFRYCACDTRGDRRRDENSVEARDECAVPVALMGPGCVREFAQYDVADGVSQWRRPNVRWPTEVELLPALGSREAVLRYAPFDSTLADAFTATWNFVPDATTFGALTSSSGALGIQTARGVLWGHGVEYQARTVPNSMPGGPPVADPFGCPSAATCPALNRLFTSHYESAPLVRVAGLRPPDSAEPGIRALGFHPLCISCARVFPTPFVGFDCGANPRCIRFGRPVHPELGAPQFQDAHGFDAPFDALLSGTLPPSISAALDDDTLDWVVAAEPHEWLAPGSTRFVALDPSLGVLAHAARADGATLEDAIAAPIAIGSASPGSRYVLSGRLRALIRVGAGNTLTLRQVETNTAATLTLSQAIGAVQAATLTSDRLPFLLVIDTSPDTTKERVLRIHLDTGQVTVLAQFNRGTRAHDLAALPGGRFAIAGWTSSELRLVLFRLQGTTIVTIGSATRALGMLGELSGDRVGVSFLRTDPVAGWRPDGVLVDELIHTQSWTLASVF
jgi:hypothetical protein